MAESVSGWAIVFETICSGLQPYFAPDAEKVDYSSFLFFSQRDAKKALLEAWQSEIESHMENPDDYEDDDIPSCDGWIIPVDLHDDKVISGEEFAWTKEDIYGFFGMEVPK